MRVANPVGVVVQGLLGYQCDLCDPGANTGRVTGVKYVVLPGVMDIVAVSVLEVQDIAQGRVESKVIVGSQDHNPRPVMIRDVVEPEPILISGNANATAPHAWAAAIFFDRHEVIAQVILVPRHGDAAVEGHERA